jgi:head-tail adaptor
MDLIMKAPSGQMVPMLCNIFKEIIGTDEINATTKDVELLYSDVPYRTKHLTAAELQATGAERARDSHRIYIPYAGYPDITEECRVVTADGQEWDITHADNVDEMGLHWELDMRLTNLRNAEVNFGDVL